jgi:RHS repeat-associated protein
LTTAPLKNASTGALIKQYSFGYDTASNRTSETVATTTTTSMPNNVNEIISQSGGANRTLSYDPNGNITSDGGTRTFEWDGANRLVAINYTGFTTRSEFTYDGLSRMVKIVEKTGATINSTRKFVWAGQEKVEFRDATDTVTQRNYSQGQHIGTTAYFYTRDNFTDLYRHSKSNFVVAVFRAYDPDLGRWLSRDPMGEPGGLHLYSYVRNDPPNSKDLSGLMPDERAIIGPFDPQRYNFMPPPDWHINRNRNNKCPRREPKEGSCSRNNTWERNPQWYAETKAGPGGHTYRGKDGSECVYDANGNLLPDAGTYNYGPDPYSLAHTFKDVLPHFLYGGGYTPGLTEIY